ncbi:MAG: ABC transporter permease [Bacteroidetes bacterium]|nr:ABC transporter permease [Bacteroidota bacterium]
MSKIKLIIAREYWTRVRKPSFIIMSILGPLFIAATFIIPLLIKANNFKTVYVQVVDYSHVYHKYIRVYNTKHLVYLNEYADQDIDKVIEKFKNSEDTVVAWLQPDFMKSPSIKVYHKDHPGLNTMTKLKNDFQDMRLKATVMQGENINLADLDKRLSTVIVEYLDEGVELKVKIFIGVAAGILMYVLIMLYGVQVMRGIMEEKTSRIVEVIISSVKPLQLLYGKIIGIALTGLTQFVILISLLLILISSSKTLFMESVVEKANVQITALQSQGQVTMTDPDEEQKQTVTDKELDQYLADLKTLAPKMLLFFPLFFMGGYLLYSSFYAAIGAAVDSETETQQFVLPVTIPIIVGILIATNIFENPNGDLAFWTSIIPLTSPIVMLARLPFMDLSTQWWEVLLSLLILYATFVFTTKLAAKIYRTGILMYGQKASYRSIMKWLRYKN